MTDYLTGTEIRRPNSPSWIFTWRLLLLKTEVTGLLPEVVSGTVDGDIALERCTSDTMPSRWYIYWLAIVSPQATLPPTSIHSVLWNVMHNRGACENAWPTFHTVTVGRGWSVCLQTPVQEPALLITQFLSLSKVMVCFNKQQLGLVAGYQLTLLTTLSPSQPLDLSTYTFYIKFSHSRSLPWAILPSDMKMAMSMATRSPRAACSSSEHCWYLTILSPIVFTRM